MTLLLAMAAVLFFAGVCCSVVAMERHGRLDLVRRAPFAQHPLGIRFRLLSQPVLVPVLLIFLTWNGFLSVVTLGWHALGLMRFIARANAELQHYAETYWGGTPQGRSMVPEAVRPQIRRTADDDECSPAEAVASDASTVAGRALEQEGLAASEEHPNAGIVGNAERMQFCPFMLYMECLAIAERGVGDPKMIAKMAIGEMVTMLEREAQRGNRRATPAHQSCLRAFQGLTAKRMAV